MTPDEMHREYYKEKPQGNHLVVPSPETLRFMEAQIQVNKDNLKDHAEIKDTLNDFKVETGKTLATIITKIDDIKVLDGKVEEIDKWKNDNCQLLEDLKSERKDSKKRLMDYAWKIALLVILSAFGVQNIEKVIAVFK